jgi:tetratricopeptide (TPR) repeat protein
VKPGDAGARNALARCLNDLAWALATHVEPARRDPARAVNLAREAVDLMPQEAVICNTLGAALYRAGRWQDALSTLEKADQLSGGKHDGFNAFFISMAHWQLGHKEAAIQWYNQAVVWMEKNQSKNQELRRFEAEAAELLNVKQKAA